jgi:type I restriction enzyme S subunit
MKAKGKAPKGDAWKAKYEEPAPPNVADLPQLPPGWVWALLGQLFPVFIGATPSRREPGYWGGSIPWVSSGEVAFCRIRATRERISELGLANSSVRLHPRGTVLLAMIGEGKTRGQAAILDIEACNNQNSAAIHVGGTEIPPEYVFYFLRYRYEETRRSSSGGNQPALNSDKVAQILIPLPPLDEIECVLSKVEERLTNIEHVVGELPKLDLKVDNLHQSVLRAAFTGKLVPQDPNDEPASVLLERIRAERSARATGNRARPVRKGRRAARSVAA